MNRFAYIALGLTLTANAALAGDGRFLTAHDFCSEQSYQLADALDRDDPKASWGVLPIGDGSGYQGSAPVEIRRDSATDAAIVEIDDLLFPGGGPQAAKTKASILIESLYNAAGGDEIALMGLSADEVARSAAHYSGYRVSDVTLKRGVVGSAAEPAPTAAAYLRLVTDPDTGELEGGCAVINTAALK